MGDKHQVKDTWMTQMVIVAVVFILLMAGVGSGCLELNMSLRHPVVEEAVSGVGS